MCLGTATVTLNVSFVPADIEEKLLGCMLTKDAGNVPEAKLILTSCSSEFPVEFRKKANVEFCPWLIVLVALLAAVIRGLLLIVTVLAAACASWFSVKLLSVQFALQKMVCVPVEPPFTVRSKVALHDFDEFMLALQPI